MFSQASEYALRAMAELAKVPAPEWVLTAHLVSRLQLPTHYLAKVLQTLARRGLLESQRGRQGGFRLAHPPEVLSAYDVVCALDDVRMFETCIMGQGACSDETACPLHSLWNGTRTALLETLQGTSLRDLADFQNRRPGAACRLCATDALPAAPHTARPRSNHDHDDSTPQLK